MRAVLLALVLGACAAGAPADPMAPLQPLMGCWRGVFPDQPDIHDERCFEALGAHVVDRHYVRPTTYGGETTYHYDDAQNEVIWAYAANDGGRSNGVVTARGDALVFPPHTFRSADGTEMRLRSTWTFDGPDRFSAFSERFENGAWVVLMRIDYERAPSGRE
jgi:hypothetical protein